MSKITKPLDNMDNWSDVKRAKTAAQLLNNTSSQEAFKALWDALDEPTRETMLSWFSTWDLEADRWEEER